MFRHAEQVPLTHPSADRRVGCFHLLSAVNSAAGNVDVKSMFEHLSSVLLGRYLGVESLGLVVILRFT